MTDGKLSPLTARFVHPKIFDVGCSATLVSSRFLRIANTHVTQCSRQNRLSFLTVSHTYRVQHKTCDLSEPSSSIPVAILAIFYKLTHRSRRDPHLSTRKSSDARTLLSDIRIFLGKPPKPL